MIVVKVLENQYCGYAYKLWSQCASIRILVYFFFKKNLLLKFNSL